MAPDQFTIIGTSANRVDGVDKVTGRAKFTGDMTVPGMLIGKFLRSPYAHARILSISTSEAERVPGVVTVLTAADLTGLHPYLRGEKRKDHPILAIDRALFAGQPVAAVAAVDELSAQEALGKIHVEYEELPAVITVQEAQADGASLVHSFAPNNLCFKDHMEKGDVEKGFAEADEIVEDTFEFPMIYHYSMEPHTAIANLDEDGITMWTSTAHPFGVRQDIAEVFGCPLSKVRIILSFVGGAFGSKSGGKIEPLVAALARKAERPVRVVLDVSEAMMTVRRHSMICKVKLGAKRDGTLVAKEASIYLNTGAYSETGPTVTSRTLTRILGPYRVPNIRVDAFCVYTNTVSAASFRSIGGPQRDNGAETRHRSGGTAQEESPSPWRGAKAERQTPGCGPFRGLW